MQLPLMPTNGLDEDTAQYLSDDPNQNRTPVLLKTGLNVWSGTVSEEYLRDLRPWSRAYKVYEEMQTDAVIGSLLESVKTPLLGIAFRDNSGEQQSSGPVE